MVNLQLWNSTTLIHAMCLLEMSIDTYYIMNIMNVIILMMYQNKNIYI